MATCFLNKTMFLLKMTMFVFKWHKRYSCVCQSCLRTLLILVFGHPSPLGKFSVCTPDRNGHVQVPNTIPYQVSTPYV